MQGAFSREKHESVARSQRMQSALLKYKAAMYTVIVM